MYNIGGELKYHKYNPYTEKYYLPHPVNDFPDDEDIWRSVKQIRDKIDDIYVKLSIEEFRLYCTYIYHCNDILIDTDGMIIMPVRYKRKVITSVFANNHTDFDKYIHFNRESYLQNISKLNWVSVSMYEAIVPGYINEAQKEIISQYFECRDKRIIIFDKEYIESKLSDFLKNPHDEACHIEADFLLNRWGGNLLKFTTNGVICTQDIDDIDIVEGEII